MHQKTSYWNKHFRKRKLWRDLYKKGNLRLRQLVKAGITFKTFYYNYRISEE